jgi:hypothetical protein
VERRHINLPNLATVRRVAKNEVVQALIAREVHLLNCQHDVFTLPSVFGKQLKNSLACNAITAGYQKCLACRFDRTFASHPGISMSSLFVAKLTAATDVNLDFAPTFTFSTLLLLHGRIRRRRKRDRKREERERQRERERERARES